MATWQRSEQDHFSTSQLAFRRLANQQTRLNRKNGQIAHIGVLAVCFFCLKNRARMPLDATARGTVYIPRLPVAHPRRGPLFRSASIVRMRFVEETQIREGSFGNFYLHGAQRMTDLGTTGWYVTVSTYGENDFTVYWVSDGKFQDASFSEDSAGVRTYCFRDTDATDPNKRGAVENAIETWENMRWERLNVQQS
jgi:hypothetical protein